MILFLTEIAELLTASLVAVSALSLFKKNLTQVYGAATFVIYQRVRYPTPKCSDFVLSGVLK